MSSYTVDFVPTVCSSTVTEEGEMGMTPDPLPTPENDWVDTGSNTRLKLIDSQYVSYQSNLTAYASRLLVMQSFVSLNNGLGFAENIASDATLGAISLILNGQIVSNDVNDGSVFMLAGLRGDTLFSQSISLFSGIIETVTAMATYPMADLDIVTVDDSPFSGLTAAQAKTLLRGGDGTFLLKLIVYNDGATAYNFNIDRVRLRVTWTSNSAPNPEIVSNSRRIRLRDRWRVR